MSFLRLLLAWLIMAAIPPQGFASAPMVFCKGGHQAASNPGADPGLANVRTHDHASHSHAVQAQVNEFANQGVDAELPHAAHECGACASCCHSLAMAEMAHWPSFSPAPRAQSAEPIFLIHATPTSVLDKPPRA